MRKVSVVALLFFMLAGCSGVKQYPLADVTGTVTCEGKPVAKAIVYFEPIPTDSTAEIGKQGFALTDENGKFTISTYGENDGAVVGKHLVRVGPSESTPKCDCALLPDEPLQEVVVQSGSANDFPLTLKKADAADRKREQQLQKSEEDEEDE
jgi:hypothetical protein